MRFIILVKSNVSHNVSHSDRIRPHVIFMTVNWSIGTESDSCALSLIAATELFQSSFGCQIVMLSVCFLPTCTDWRDALIWQYLYYMMLLSLLDIVDCPHVAQIHFTHFSSYLLYYNLIFYFRKSWLLWLSLCLL